MCSQMETNPYESPREAIAAKPYDWFPLCVLGLRLAVACFIAFLVINTMSPKPHSAGMLFVLIAGSTTVYGFIISIILIAVGGIGWLINRKAHRSPVERSVGESPPPRRRPKVPKIRGSLTEDL